MKPITGVIRPGFGGEAIRQAIEQSNRLDAVDRICRAENPCLLSAGIACTLRNG